MNSVTEIVWKDIQQNEELEAIIEKVIQKCFEVEHINPTSLYICVTLTNPKNIREINKEYRNIDKDMVIRIFENLISNIIKYSDSNCNIVLSENGKISFSNKASKLDVTTVKRIFDRYYTLENMKKYSGLGLAIAKQLVELNGGMITAKYLKNELYIELLF